MTFLNADFMLKNEKAKQIYKFIEDMPIFDYHCHLDPKEIYEDKPFEDIVELWLNGDHYKWRLMRANGISEKLITGNADKKDKFKAWAETVSKAFGNPLYHWSHLELYRIFGIAEEISMENWEQIYDKLNSIIRENKISPRKLIERANVKFIGTTDDPLDDLQWHKRLSEDSNIKTVVAPTFRPDKAFVEHKDFINFVSSLGEKTGIKIDSFEDLIDALENRVKYFVNFNSCASDHSIAAVEFMPATKDELNNILRKALSGEKISEIEIKKWQTELFVHLNRIYKKYNMVFQLHFGPQRNTYTKYYEKLGADTGFDSIGDQTNLAQNLTLLINYLAEKGCLTKSIFYNINPVYNTVVANNLQNFQINESNVKMPLQFGAAWWFADNERGMLDQMKTLSEQGMLANFVGMLTDSRSFLSYQRHDYFRRILATMVGEWVEKGEIPNNDNLIKNFVEDISYNNAARFFKGDEFYGNDF